MDASPHFSSHVHKDLDIHSHQYDFTKLSLAEEIHVVHIILPFSSPRRSSDDCTFLMAKLQLQRLRVSVCTERNVQVSVYKS